MLLHALCANNFCCWRSYAYWEEAVNPKRLWCDECLVWARDTLTAAAEDVGDTASEALSVEAYILLLFLIGICYGIILTGDAVPTGEVFLSDYLA